MVVVLASLMFEARGYVHTMNIINPYIDVKFRPRVCVWILYRSYHVSPHLHTTRERIRIGHDFISKADFVRLWEETSRLLEGQGDWVLFFDKLLAIALMHFMEEEVEYAILEVGVGGRFDPTNFVERPAVAVITSISLDHMDLLGDTLDKIAWQKAGIMKKGAPVVTCDHHDPQVVRVLREEASRIGCELHLVVDSPVVPSPTTTRQEDTRLAQVALEVLGITRPNFDGAHLVGRFEVFQPWEEESSGPTIILDVAHNKDSIARLLTETTGR